MQDKRDSCFERGDLPSVSHTPLPLVCAGGRGERGTCSLIRKEISNDHQCKRFSESFRSKKTEELAREVGFLKREGGKIAPHDFLRVLVFGSLASSAPSLESTAGLLPGTVTRQAVDAKFTEEGAKFFHRALLRVLRHVEGLSTDRLETKYLDAFAHVYLQDGSSWDLRPGLKDLFPGSGGSASPANAKLQLIYEYKTCQTLPLVLSAGKHPDSTYGALMVETMSAGDLGIFDLGYYDTKTFEKIDQKKAFFVSRFKPTAGVWIDSEGRMERVNLTGLLRSRKGPAVELTVFLRIDKANRFLKCRMVAFRVPPEVAELRRSRLRKTAEKKGRNVSPVAWELCEWSLFITNAPPELVPSRLIRTLYRIRWTVELVFKQFKSVLKIHRSNTENEHRMKAETYAKLIAAVLVHALHAQVHISCWNEKRQEYSFDKVWKRVQERAGEICRAFRKGTRRLTVCLQDLLATILKTCRKRTQPSALTSLQRIDRAMGDATPVILSPADIESFHVGAAA